MHILRPAPGERVYGAVLKFRLPQDWTAFQQSPEYMSFLTVIEPLIEGPQQVETMCGLESWFTPIGERVTRVPPRWKMAVVTWIGVSFVVLFVNLGLSWWPPELLEWLRFLVSNALVVAVLTWAVMPLLSHLFRKWLQSR